MADSLTGGGAVNINRLTTCPSCGTQGRPGPMSHPFCDDRCLAEKAFPPEPPDTEPKATCKDHPGDYGTNCPACERDKRRYREWRQRQSVSPE